MRLRSFVLVAAAVVVASLALSAWAWAQLPADAQVPIHWGIDGRPDGFAPKSVGLLLMPAVIVAITGLLVAVPAVEPRREHLVRSRSAYRTVSVGVVVMLGVVHAIVVLAAVGRPVEVDAAVTLLVGALFVVTGNVLGKTRSTFLFGIRTPWTLTSERSWTRTHRLGGRLMVLLGLAMIVAVLLGLRGAALFVLLAGGGLLVIAAIVTYSYVVWRNDPDRRPLGDAR